MRDKKLSTKVISWTMAIILIVTLFSVTNQMNVTASGEEAASGALVAHWTFDGNYNESASGLSTELGDPDRDLTYTDGIFGKAAVFNGKDNYLVVEANDILNLGNSRDTDNANMTVSAWIRLNDSDTSDKYLLDKGMEWGWGQNDGYYWTNPYRVYFTGCQPRVRLSNDFSDSHVDPQYITQGNAYAGDKYVEAGEWFLLTVTYDGKRIKIYHDTELLSQSNYSDGLTFNNDETFIGIDYTLTNFFEGTVDDLRIYKTTLTHDEVEALYQQGVASNKEFLEPTKQLAAYYAFDDNLKDSSAFGNDAITGNDDIEYGVGKNGKAIVLSEDSYIVVPAADQLNFDTEFTVSFWIKPDKEGSFPILCRQNPYYADNNDNDYTYLAAINSWSGAEYTNMSMNTMVYDPHSWCMFGGQSITSSFNYSEDKIKGTDWFHYTYTYQDGQMKSYLNGVLQDKSETSDLVNIANASGDLLIGYDGNDFLSGMIDELKIYNKCLSAKEVKNEAKRIDSISLSKASAESIASIGKGKSVKISPILLKDIDNEENIKIKLPNKDITMISSDSKIFTVTAGGKITGVKAGKAKLTIAYGPHKVTYEVVVK